MDSLTSRVAVVNNRPVVQATGKPVDDLIRRLEAGESIDQLADGPGGALDLIAALAFAALGEDGSPGCSLIQRPPSRPRLAHPLSAAELGRLFPEAARAAVLALASGLLQAHDFWEAGHEAAQEADDLGERRFSSYWHAVAHRREPDPGNASYWFRRVGRHPVFAGLAEAAAPLLKTHGDDRLTDRLIGGGGWNSSAMTELCTRARPGDDQETLARRLQRLEMGLLLAATAETAAAAD